MANRNDELYWLYLNAHIYASGRSGDVARLLESVPSDDGSTIDVRTIDSVVAVALGERHGKSGADVLSIERLIMMVDEMVTMPVVVRSSELPSVGSSGSATKASASVASVTSVGSATGVSVDADAVANKIGVKVARQTTTGGAAPWMVPLNDVAGASGPVPSRATWNNALLKWEADIPYPNSTGRDLLLMVDITPSHWKQRSQSPSRYQKNNLFGAARALVSALAVAQENGGPLSGNEALASLVHLHVGLGGVAIVVVVRWDRSEAFIRAEANLVAEYINTLFQDQASEVAHENLPNAADLADMKAGTQGLGVVTEKTASAPSTSVVTMVVSAKWAHSLGEVTEKSLMDDRRIATAARSETGKTDADEVIEGVQLLARRDHAALALSLQIMPLNTTIKHRDDIRVALGFAEPPLPEWVKPGAWAFFPKGSGKGDYLQIIDIVRDNVIFRLPMGRTLMCPNGVVRIATQGLCELEWIIERANRENLPISQMVAVFERELAKGEALNLV